VTVAAISQSWIDAGIVAGIVSGIIGCAYTVHRAIRSVRAWFERIWDRAETLFSKAVDQSGTGHLVRYHLGPNGTTTPMHTRMARLEAAHDIEDRPQEATS
jgi:hypothetical protein